MEAYGSLWARCGCGFPAFSPNVRRSLSRMLHLDRLPGLDRTAQNLLTPSSATCANGRSCSELNQRFFLEGCSFQKLSSPELVRHILPA